MIIGLTGKKQSGKSTAAQYIKETYGAVRLNFKDGLIAELIQNFPDLLKYYQHQYGVLDVEDLFIAKEPPIRFLMQNYGTEVRRHDNPHYWVDQWKLRATGNVVVDDVRFINEANAVKEKGGIIIRIERPDMESTDTHQSEMEMDSIIPDFTIVSTLGDLNKLYRDIDAIVQKTHHE